MIKGEKIYLRPIVKEDITYLNKWKNDEDTFMYLGGGFMPASIDHQVKWLDAMIDMAGANKRFIICDVEDNPVGLIGLYSINWIHRTCEIGVYIGEVHARGQGFSKDACTVVEEFARNYLNLRKINLSVVSRNTSAIKLWYSLGYNKVGEYSQERFINGRYENLTIMEKFIDSITG